MNRLRRGLVAAGGTVLLTAALGALVWGPGGEEDRPHRSPAEALAAGADGISVQELPPGVTPEMVEQGRELFRGAGLCYTCHGQDARGREGLGSDLTDSEWNHGDGSYEYLVNRIDEGVSAQESTTGMPMPPRGGAVIGEAQVEAVAAYVWTLSRK